MPWRRRPGPISINILLLLLHTPNQYKVIDKKMILPFTKIVRVKHCYEVLPATFYHDYKGTYYKVNFILQHEVKNQRNAAFPYYTHTHI